LRRNDIASNDGFSLVEILITVAIVGITFTAILGGLITTITASAYQRKAATADAIVRSAAVLV
jgi:prepilin-type N-terminal cleavage/methylation domain-containing protein